MRYSNKLSVCSRTSSLARAQVQEILVELQNYHPSIQFDIHYLSSTGDLDLLTSLRDLGRTDFFTKELDELVLRGACRIAIHSAKDLPHPLPEGLSVICLTKGLDPADSLVLQPGIGIDELPAGALIATSSARREEAVLQMRADCTFCDLRGTIEQRLTKLTRGEVEGVVIAEAALIRLGLTHLNRVRLPLPTTEGQGKLAIVARTEDQEMSRLFTCLHFQTCSKS